MAGPKGKQKVHRKSKQTYITKVLRVKMLKVVYRVIQL